MLHIHVPFVCEGVYCSCLQCYWCSAYTCTHITVWVDYSNLQVGCQQKENSQFVPLSAESTTYRSPTTDWTNCRQSRLFLLNCDNQLVHTHSSNLAPHVLCDLFPMWSDMASLLHCLSAWRHCTDDCILQRPLQCGEEPPPSRGYCQHW